MADSVRDQYEAYPYPLRSPAEDQQRVRTVSPLENLHLINHYLFAGERDLRQPIRVLVAGGGTGDGLVCLGSQMRELSVPGEIVYLDLSTASRRVAEERVAALGLDQVTFVTGSLLDLCSLDLGSFDYINCSGVLHHLPEPEAGLRALAAALAPGGGIGVMVYGELGRTGIYHAQQALQWLAPEPSLAERVPVARRFLAELPHSNWLTKNEGLRYVDTMADEELVDRFLHSCDRAYRVEQVAGLTAAADLQLVALAPPLLYDPRLYLLDPELKRRAMTLPPLKRQALAELLFGMIARHSFFASSIQTSGATVAQLKPSSVPVLLGFSGATLANRAREAGTVNLGIAGTQFRLPVKLSGQHDAILRACDGKRDLATIHRHLCGQKGHEKTSWRQLVTAFMDLKEIYGGAGLLALANPVPGRS